MPNSPEQQREELILAAQSAGVAAAKEVLRSVGINIDDPLESQADFTHLRMMRRIAERLGATIVVTVITMMLTAIFAIVGYKMWGGKP